jgi:glycosyltransferase involved in cell wall biosynthesis
VVIAARNEGARLNATLLSIAAGRTTRSSVEIVIVSDASSDGTNEQQFSQLNDLTIKFIHSRKRLGVARARNLGAREATSHLLFITDAHVRFPHGWDRIVLEHTGPRRILAATIVDLASGSKGYGCRLVVPHMGTFWNFVRPSRPEPVQIASSSGTVLPRSLFKEIGGYDEGMRIYGAVELEFSLRAWLSGAYIFCIPELEIAHEFKEETQRHAFLRRNRTNLVHNGLRFGACYLPEASILEMTRYYAIKFPRNFPKALKLLVESDVWDRRDVLQKSLPRNFDWFVQQFSLLDQVGRPLPLFKSISSPN